MWSEEQAGAARVTTADELDEATKTLYNLG